MQDRSEIFCRIKQQYFREQLAPLGFQPMDGMILYLLWGGNCLRQEDIAAQTALDKGAVARSVARLEERGLVERWVSDQCRRDPYPGWGGARWGRPEGPGELERHLLPGVLLRGTDTV